MKKWLFLILLSLFSLLAIFVYQFFKFSDKRLHLVFCDVGQGDAVFIRTPKGADILVDGGPDDKVLDCLSNHMPFWDKQIELVFLTHPHADHLAGLISVAKHYKIQSFNTEKASSDSLVFGELEKILEEKKIKKRYIYEGDNIKISDGTTLKTLWPGKKYIEQADKSDLDKNSFSLVQLLEYKDFSLLLTGDIQAEILDGLAANVPDLDILKIPHHGSKTGISDKTFEIIKPSYAIISSGKNNRYNHPAEYVISLLEKHRIDYKRTDMEKEIEFVIDKEGKITQN